MLALLLVDAYWFNFLTVVALFSVVSGFWNLVLYKFRVVIVVILIYMVFCFYILL